MVNFNNEATIAVPAADILRVVVLERRHNVIEAIEYYLKNKSGRNDITDIEVIRSRLYCLFLETGTMIEKRLQPEELKELEEDLQSDSILALIRAFKRIDQFLYDINLTKLDYKKNIDWTNAEAVNKAFGYE